MLARAIGGMPESAPPEVMEFQFHGETIKVVKNNPNQILNPKKVWKRLMKQTKGPH